MDTKEFCRLCLKGKNVTLIWVFDKRFQDNNHMKDLILKTTGLEISKQDDISQKICPQCGEVVIKFYEFRQQCLKSDQFLKEQQKKQLQRKKPDPSILELFEKYPRLHLPKLCIFENISPVVEMEMDEVENYFKSKNRNFERQVELIMSEKEKQNQKSKEMVSPISIKFVQDKSSYEVVHKTSKEEHDFNVKNPRKRHVSDSEQHCASKKLIIESDFPGTEPLIMRRQSTGPVELNPKNEKLNTYLMEALEASETRSVPILGKIAPNCQLNPDIVSNITKSVAIEILHQNKSNEILKSTKTSSDCIQTTGNSHLVHNLDPMRNMDIPNYLGIRPINNLKHYLPLNRRLPINRHLPLNPSTFGDPSKAVTENLITEVVIKTKTKTYPNSTHTFEASIMPLDSLNRTVPEIQNSNLNLIEKSGFNKEFQNRKENNSSQQNNSVPTKSNLPSERFIEDKLKPKVVTKNLVTAVVTKTKTYPNLIQSFEAFITPLNSLNKTVPEIPNSNLNVTEKSVLNKEFQNRKENNSSQQNNSVPSKSNVPSERFIVDTTKTVTKNLITEVVTKTYPNSTQTFEASMKPFNSLNKTLLPEIPNSNLNLIEKSVLNKGFQNRKEDNSSQQNNSVPSKSNVPSERFIGDKLKFTQVIVVPKKVTTEKSIKVPDLHIKPQIGQVTTVNLPDRLPKPNHVILDSDKRTPCTAVENNSMNTDKAITNAEFSCNFCREMFASKKSCESHLKICYVKEAVEVTTYVLLEKVENNIDIKKRYHNVFKELATIAPCNKIDEVIDLISDDDDDERTIKPNPILENKKATKPENKKEVVTPVLKNEKGCEPILSLIPELQIKNSRFSNMDFKSNSVNTLKSLLESFKNLPESFQNSQTDITSESPELNKIVFEFKKKPNNDSIVAKTNGPLVLQYFVLQNLKSLVDLYKIPIHINNGKRFEIIYKEDVPSKRKRNYKDWKDLALIDIQVDDNRSRDTPLSTVLKESSTEVQNLAHNSNPNDNTSRGTPVSTVIKESSTEVQNLTHNSNPNDNTSRGTPVSTLIKESSTEVQNLAHNSNPNSEKTSLIYSIEAQQSSCSSECRENSALNSIEWLNREISNMVKIGQLSTTHKPSTPPNQMLSETLPDLSYLDELFADRPNNTNNVNEISTPDGCVHSFDQRGSNIPNGNEFLNIPQMASSNNSQQKSYHMEHQNFLRLKQQNSLRLNKQKSLRLNKQKSLRLNKQNSLRSNQQNSFDLNRENGFSQTVNLQQNINQSGEYQNHSNFATRINSDVTTLTSANDINTLGLGQACNKNESGFRNNVENNIDKKQKNLKKSQKVTTSGLFVPPQITLNYVKNNRPMTMNTNLRPPPPSYQQTLKSNQIFQQKYSMPNNQTTHYYPYSNHIVNISRKSITPNVCVLPTFNYRANMDNGASGNVVGRQEYTNSDVANDNSNSSNIRVRPLNDMK